MKYELDICNVARKYRCFVEKHDDKLFVIWQKAYMHISVLFFFVYYFIFLHIRYTNLIVDIGGAPFRCNMSTQMFGKLHFSINNYAQIPITNADSISG